MKVVHRLSDLRLIKGMRVYECSVCSKLFNWNYKASWYGSYRDQEDKPDEVQYRCSDECK